MLFRTNVPYLAAASTLHCCPAAQPIQKCFNFLKNVYAVRDLGVKSSGYGKTNKEQYKQARPILDTTDIAY